MSALNPQDAMEALRRTTPARARIYAPGCSAEARVFIDVFQRNPALASGLTFLGIWIPGVNHTDYAGLHDTARAESIFMAPPLRKSFEQGGVDLRPLSYVQAYQWLETTPLDAAIFQVSAPDADGNCSLGVCADFAPAILARDDVVKVAHINPDMPRPSASPTTNIETFNLSVATSAPLLTYAPPAPPSVFDAIAERIAALISDGDTLQFGLGNVQLAVLKAIEKKRKIRIHSGMISDPVLNAIDAGCISSESGAVTAGVALGSKALYQRCAHDPRFRFAPVCETHTISTLSAIENFVAINSVIEVDLLGQANAEYIGARQVSGAGGLVDFLRGAHESRGGKPIIALASTAKQGAVSRIVPKLSAASVSIARADVGIVVTEHGTADLRGKTIEERAQALIAIADPRHRADLQSAWPSIRDAL